MHDRHWDNDFAWWWLTMVLMMALVAGAIIWAVAMRTRRSTTAPNLQTTATAPPAASQPTPREILAERLARSEIDLDEYRQRLDALAADDPARGRN